ncbi:hypothetical protein HRM2_41280 [Desulforapulum autotrophicum HRM2]|uniref:Uncharacterized protein n=1 Tax=Desulforapulum autotrophicum (strain ATCC 43914 / DSM 3382 / VKM B-1955 / HRM2) TaxID=177437 RepID=C0QCV3_DESAH|nr:hypothetical protein HRM2_41280 [Desulforapulum autotrophicum HRM2]
MRIRFEIDLLLLSKKQVSITDADDRGGAIIQGMESIEPDYTNHHSTGQNEPGSPWPGGKYSRGEH